MTASVSGIVHGSTCQFLARAWLWKFLSITKKLQDWCAPSGDMWFRACGVRIEAN